MQIPPRLDQSFGTRLLDSVHHIEDRQIHCEDHTTDDYAEEYDHEGFHCGEEATDGGVDLFVVEVGDLAEHFVEATGLFADGDHRDDHGWEDGGFLEWCSDRVAAGDAGAAGHDCVLDNTVTCSFGGNFEPFEDTDAGADQSAESSGEARDGTFAENVAEDGDIEELAIDGEIAGGSGVVAFERVEERYDCGENRPPVSDEEVGESDNDAGWERERETNRREHFGESWDNEDEERRDSDGGDGENGSGVDHGTADLSHERVAFFHERGEAQKNNVEDTAGFAGGDHVDVETAKGFGAFFERVGERVSAFDVEEYLTSGAGEHGIFCLSCENIECLNER